VPMLGVLVRQKFATTSGRYRWEYRSETRAGRVMFGGIAARWRTKNSNASSAWISMSQPPHVVYIRVAAFAAGYRLFTFRFFDMADTNLRKYALHRRLL
jgi:hypothetical protein